MPKDEKYIKRIKDREQGMRNYMDATYDWDSEHEVLDLSLIHI